MRHPILMLLVAVCACSLHGDPAAAQSRIGQAGGAAPRGMNPRGGGGHHHGPVSPPAAQPPHAHRHQPSWSGGGHSRGGRHDHHHHSGRRSGGFGFGLGIGGFGLSGGYGYGGWPGYGFSYGYDYLPAYPLYGGYYHGLDLLYPPGYDDFSFSYTYVPRRHLISPPPQWIPAVPNEPGHGDPLQDAPGRGQPFAVEPLPADQGRIAESSPAAKLRSVRAQGFGDQWFRQQQYQLARDRYKSAVQNAPDRAEARFRLAFAYAALGAYELAVREIKAGLELNPSWPSTGESLDALFGESNRVAKLSLISRVGTWVQEHRGDPDRPFLLAILHYFDEDMEKALPLFEAARRLGQPVEYVELFIAPEQPQLGAPIEVPRAAPQANQVPGTPPADEFLPPLPGSAEAPEPAPADEDAAAEQAPSGPVLPPLPQP